MRPEFKYYELLGCHAQSTDEEIIVQWRIRARAQHPDRSTCRDGGEAFARLTVAYHATRTAARRARLARTLALLGTGCSACSATGAVRRQRGFSNVLTFPCSACYGSGYISN